MRPILGSFLLPFALTLFAAHGAAPLASSRPDDPLDELSSRLQDARLQFESALAVPPDELDVPEAGRRFHEVLIDLQWELARLRERSVEDRPGSWRLLIESRADELELSWARLHDVASVTPQVRALARLHIEMSALVDAGRSRAALALFDARLPEPLDPLDWPSVVRRRLRDVERLAQTVRASLPQPSPTPGADPRSRPR